MGIVHGLSSVGFHEIIGAEVWDNIQLYPLSTLSRLMSSPFIPE
jgi:hypothetical protein